MELAMNKRLPKKRKRRIFQSSADCFTCTSFIRYIMLDNGLRALLISDYRGPAASEDEDSDSEGEEEEEDDEEEEDSESGDESGDESEEEEDDDDGSDGDDEDEGKKKRRNAEKQVLPF